MADRLQCVIKASGASQERFIARQWIAAHKVFRWNTESVASIH